jgi:hypothetical protein
VIRTISTTDLSSYEIVAARVKSGKMSTCKPRPPPRVTSLAPRTAHLHRPGPRRPTRLFRIYPLTRQKPHHSRDSPDRGFVSFVPAASHLLSFSDNRCILPRSYNRGFVLSGLQCRTALLSPNSTVRRRDFGAERSRNEPNQRLLVGAQNPFEKSIGHRVEISTEKMGKPADLQDPIV